VYPQTFFEEALLPLVRGGEVMVGEPIDADGLAAIIDPDAPGQSGARASIAEARRAVAETICLAPPPLELDDEALHLAVALYDALFLTHPDARGRSEKARARVAEFAEACARLAPPPDGASLLARHTVLHALFRIVRTDHRVSFWAGAREFRGQPPPKRILRWGRLRRVRVEDHRINWHRQAGLPLAARAILRRLLASSPLTDLASPLRGEPALSLEAGAPFLGDPEIARFLCAEYLGVGLPRIYGVLGAALAAFLRNHAAPADARLVLAFLTHLHILDALAPDGGLWLESLEGAPLSVEPMEFIGLFAASHRLEFGPSGLTGPLRQSLDRRAGFCRRLAGQGIVDALTGELERLGVKAPIVGAATGGVRMGSPR
jgi:hypothetical protein